MKTIKQLLITIAVLLCSATLHAHDFEVDGIYYNILSSANHTVEVTYKGEWSDSFSNEYHGDVVIPEEVVHNGKTYSVTTINYSAFESCTSLTSVVIPNSVKTISPSAFQCTGLTNVTIPNSVTSLGYDAFKDCYFLASITIGNGIERIGDDTFMNCHSLTSITIPSYVTSIAGSAFSGCNSLKELYIEDSEKTLSLGYNEIDNNGDVDREGMFSQCPLETLYCGRDLDRNSYYSPFLNTNELKSATLGGYMTSIGSNAFVGCTSLTSITIPNSVTSIGSRAFEDCTSLTSITIPNSVTSIGSSAFEDCTSLTSITIPNSVTSIGSWAFMNCTGLTSITIPNSVTSIGSSAFVYCTNLIHIYMLSRIANVYNESIFSTVTYNNATLYVPDGRKFAYSQTIPWSNFYIEELGNYTVTYKIDGEVYETYSVEYFMEIPIPETPTKDGYTFSGWSEIPESMPAQDITIEGSFIANIYEITYIVDGEVYNVQSVACDAIIPDIEEPVKEGYTFSGWSDIPETMPAEDVTVTGSFSINSYDLVYMIDGEEYKRIALEFGSEIIPEEEPVKEGYTFSGWSDIPETMPAKDITITGSFSINSYNLVYMVDGEEYKRVTLEFGSEIVPEEEPEKEGYTFSGWSEIPETIPAEDVTITGSFSINSYDLVYMIDGEEYKRVTLEFGSEIIPEEEPIKEGYTFSGWSEIPETMPAEDITVTGSFSINSYDLVYMIDGEEYKRVTLEFGSEIVPEEEPVKEGYTFSGWSEIPETMPAENVTITGSFSINSYDLVYMVDGEEYKRVTLEFGSKVVPEEEPTKEGYTFSGWSEIPETMPAHDVEVTGSFIPTNVSEITAEVSLQINGNNISLSNANNNTVAIYSINGVLVKKIDKYTGEEITLEKGVYIISVGDKAMKIKL